MYASGNANRVAHACLTILLAATSQAQNPTLQWERVGDSGSVLSSTQIEGFGFRLGSDPLGSLDTLYAVSTQGVFGFAPSADDWMLLCNASRCRTDYMEVTSEGYLLIGSTAGPASEGERSIDGGRSWEHDVVGVSVTVLFQSTLLSLDRPVFACNGVFCARSTEGGAKGSWTAGGPMGGAPAALTEALPSAALPQGRLIGGAWNGAAYSDDGGGTWMPSSLWGPGRYAVASVAFLPQEGHPYGGRAFAGVTDFATGLPGVYRSDDGGGTWTLVRQIESGDFGVADPNWVRVGVDPRIGGAIYAGIEDNVPGTDPDLGTVVRSPDGGATWELVADSSNGWGGFAVYLLKVGRDGRLYVGTDRGVWRTVQPVPVAREPLPGGQHGRGPTIDVWPNPSSTVVHIWVSVATAAHAGVYILDVSGRLIEVIFEDSARSGSVALTWDASDVAPGVYLVVADANGVRRSRRVVISGS